MMPELGRLSDDQKVNFQQLIDRISHALRSPLTAVKAAASLLRNAEAKLDLETRRELVMVIDEEADRLNDLVDKMIWFARLECHDQDYPPQPTSIESVLAKSRAALTDRLALHQLTLALPDTLPLVQANPELLGQAFIFILENAAYYSPPGSEIKISASNCAGTIQLLFTDRGSGIAETDLPHIFEPFYRSTNRSEKSGAGLGLAICQRIISAYQGRIWINSASETGTTINIELPELVS